LNLKHAYHNWTDEALMQEVALKNKRAFEALYARYSRPMFSFFYRMLWKNKELSNDLCQEIFTKVVLHAEQFDRSRPFKTWLYSIANNMCKNEYAKHAVRKQAQMNIPTSTDTQTAQQLDLSQFKKHLQRLIQELDEVKKQTIELRFFQELSVPEIAQTMECSEGTVKSRIFYVLKEFQQELKIYKEILTSILIIIHSLL
jgi:RNA polymerase sigma-70 factor (ECF subfamily)